jgi:hypothetical protein
MNLLDGSVATDVAGLSAYPRFSPLDEFGNHKCDSLMAAMGMSDYRLNIRELAPHTLISTFRHLS